MSEGKNFLDRLRASAVDPTQRSFDNLTAINTGYGQIEGALPGIQHIGYHTLGAAYHTLMLPKRALGTVLRTPGTVVSAISGLIRGTSDMYRRALLYGETQIDKVLKKPEGLIEKLRPSESKH